MPKVIHEDLMPRLHGRMRADEHVPHAGPDADGDAAAAPAMKPSTTTGMRSDAPPSMSPLMAASSGPPTLASTSTASLVGAVDCNAAPDEAGLVADALGRDAGADACHLVNRRAVSTAAMAEEGEVLPMPISPAPISRIPLF